MKKGHKISSLTRHENISFVHFQEDDTFFVIIACKNTVSRYPKIKEIGRVYRQGYRETLNQAYFCAGRGVLPMDQITKI